VIVAPAISAAAPTADVTSLVLDDCFTPRKGDIPARLQRLTTIGSGGTWRRNSIAAMAQKAGISGVRSQY